MCHLKTKEYIKGVLSGEGPLKEDVCVHARPEVYKVHCIVPVCVCEMHT